MDHAIDEAVTRPRPDWLTEQEVDLQHDPTVTPTSPVPAIAYVRFHEGAIRLEVEVVAWNEHAVRIRFTGRDGQTHEG